MAGRFRIVLGRWFVVIATLAAVAATIAFAAAPQVSGATTPKKLDLPRLDQDQWELVQLLIALEPAELDAVVKRLHRESPDPTRTNGSSEPEDPKGEPDCGASDRQEGVIDALLNRIIGKVDSIISKADGITSRTNSLLSRIPDRDDFRSLGGDGRPSEIRNLLDDARDIVDGVLSLIREQKAGYDDFVGGAGGSCAVGSPCGEFKASLNRVFDDAEEAWLTVQKLRCMDRPDAVLIPLNTQLFRTLLIDRAPLVVLHLMKKLLDQSEGWDTRIREMIDEIPVELTEFCETAAVSPFRSRIRSLSPAGGSTCLGSPNRICCVLRPEFRGKAIWRAKSLADTAEMIFKIVGAWTTDDKNATVGANVVAGATAGTNVKNPPDGMMGTLEAISSKLSSLLEGMHDRRSDCLDADGERERDLQSCTATVAYVLPQGLGGGVWDELDELVELRIEDVESTGRDAAEARAFLESARLSPGTRSGFDSLCDAYQSATGRNTQEGGWRVAPSPGPAPRVR